MFPNLSQLSRRDLLRLAKIFGWTSLLLGAGTLSGILTTDRLVRAAEAVQRQRSRKKARHQMIFGAATLVGGGYHISALGILEFIRDLEARCDGEVRIELIDNNEICNQLNCIKRTQQGVVDFYYSSTQNAAAIADYFNVLDFPYLFPNRAAQYHFFYHPLSEPLLREPLRKHYGIWFLFAACRLRGVMLGLKWRDKPDVRRIEQLAGLKIRVTASQMGRLALQLLGAETIPVPWCDTRGALQHGMVDGMETWEAAAARVMPEVISQVLDLRLFSGTGHTAMNAARFEALEPHLQDAVMESAYYAQMLVQLQGEASLINTVGASHPPKAGTVFDRHNIRFVALGAEELRKAERLCAPEFNPEPWTEHRERLNFLVDGWDVYTDIHRIAREIPPDTLAENVAPRRWWT